MFRSFYLIIAFLFFAIIVRAQEKRIALVIGNADYLHASPLKNPINDAELMKTTLASLGFEVIEAKNLKTQRQFLDTIRSFQRKSASYNVRFVYYAGHAVQIGEENYLLPTEEKYQNATDFKDYAIPLGLITKEFTAEENLSSVINVVILDACRDNPNKNVESRGVVIESLYKERSSNEVLIAYATTSGATAADGLKDGKNSVFCSSLAKHMMLPDVPFEEVLKRVRIDVKTSLNQRPEYLNSLDHTLYLKKSSYTDQIIKIDSLIEKEDYNLARAKLDILLEKAPNYKLALLRKARIEYKIKNKNYDGFHLFKADSLYPNDPEVYEYFARYYAQCGEFDKALKYINNSIAIDSQDPDLFYFRAFYHEERNKINDALQDYSRAIELDSKNALRYVDRAYLYSAYFKDLQLAVDDIRQAIKLQPNNDTFHVKLGDIFSQFNELKLAEQSYQDALRLNPENVDAFNNLGILYEDKGELDRAIELYTEGTKIEKINPESAAFCYANRGRLSIERGKINDALQDYSRAIDLDSKNALRYVDRAYLYSDYFKDLQLALDDIRQAIKLQPNNDTFHVELGDIFYQFNQLKLAEQSYQDALRLNPENVDAINDLGVLYQSKGELDRAIELYTEGIKLEKINPETAAFCYANRGYLSMEQGKINDALQDYSRSIDLDSKNAFVYSDRAYLYSAYFNELQLALDDIRQAIKLQPNNDTLYYAMGDIFSQFNQLNSAEQSYQDALRLNPENVDAISKMAIIYQDKGEVDRALKLYHNAINLEKINPQTTAFCFEGRGDIYFEQGKFEMALSDYTKAIELEPYSYRYANRADVYVALNKPYEALSDYTLAISLDSMSTYLYWGRGQIFSDELNNQEMAINDFNQILKIEPNNINALNWKSIFYHRNNDLSAAIEGYKKIIDLGDSIKKLEIKVEDYGWANINLAEIYQCDNKIEKASKLYNEAVSYMPEYAKGYYWRAWFSALYLSKYDEAIHDFSTSIKLEPQNPHWLLNRSKIYQMKGDLKSAKNDINEAVKISKESAIYIAERGNYYSITGEYDKATKDFKKSLKLDTANRRTFHYITEDLIRQGKLNDAIKNATITNKLFKNDTVSFEQLGRIYLSNNDFHKSLSAYSKAASIMEFNEGYRTIDPHEVQVFLSDIYLKIAEIYEKLNQSDLKCESLRKAKEIVIFETRPDRQIMIKEIQEKLKMCQN